MYVTRLTGPALVELTAAPVPLITDSMPPELFSHTVSRSLNWTPEVFGAWKASAF